MGEQTTTGERVRLPNNWYFTRGARLWRLHWPDGRIFRGSWKEETVRAFAASLAPQPVEGPVSADLRALSDAATPGEWRVEADTTLVWGDCIINDDGETERLGVPVVDAQFARGWSKDGQPDLEKAHCNAILSAAAVNDLRARIAASDRAQVQDGGGARVWLIEWPEDESNPPRWFRYDAPDKPWWHRDANLATWFVRREDAECAISRGQFASGVRATEHVFVERQLAAAPSAAAPAVARDAELVAPDVSIVRLIDAYGGSERWVIAKQMSSRPEFQDALDKRDEARDALLSAFSSVRTKAPTPDRSLREAGPDLAALLREVLDGGLIYWEPQTKRGHVAKADMLARCEAALADHGKGGAS